MAASAGDTIHGSMRQSHSSAVASVITFILFFFRATSSGRTHRTMMKGSAST